MSNSYDIHVLIKRAQAYHSSKFIYQNFVVTYSSNKISTIGICIEDLITWHITRKPNDNLFSKTVINRYGAHLQKQKNILI
jgi:hypothetical protein